MEPLALAGVVLLLLVKEAGLPIPVPGDLIVVGAGAALAADATSGIAALALILLAGFIGGTIQFWLMRGPVRARLLRVLTRFGVPEARIELLASWIRRTGARGVAISRMTPGVRIGAIAAAGIAGIRLGTFVRGLVAGNTVFVTGHFVLGFILGASAAAVIGQATGAVVPVVGAVVVLALVGALGWLLIRRRRAASGQSALASWTDAACPACLTLAVARIEPLVGVDPSIATRVGER